MPQILKRTRKINLVLIGGKALSGKTTSSKYLYDKLTKEVGDSKCIHTSFAAPIKDIASDVFGWDGKKDEKGRRLLQVIGTEAGRAYNENIWVETLHSRIVDYFPPYFVFVDDWRFPNEKSFFENDFFFDVTSIRINRHISMGNETDLHPSETSLPEAGNENLIYDADGYYNFVINNDSTLEELYKKLEVVSDYLKSKIIYDKGE